MAEISIEDVFTPTTIPTYTYVERSEENLATALAEGLRTPGQIVSVAGPSKSGKTVMIAKVAGADNLIAISGEGIKQPSDIWDRVLQWMDAPVSRTTRDTHGRTLKAGVDAGGSVGIPLVAKGHASVTSGVETNSEHEAATTRSGGGYQQAKRELADSTFIVLIDDFHYMSQAVQSEVAKNLKQAANDGLNIVIASVPHRGDDAVRANPDLRGRVLEIDIPYWTPADLRLIAEKGLDALRVTVAEPVIAEFVREAAGSPQLMQRICLSACRQLGIHQSANTYRALALASDTLSGIYHKTSTAVSYNSLVVALLNGPRVRGVARTAYRFRDGSAGDVYACVLRAVAADPPRQSFPYDDILQRTREVCEGQSPAGSSVTSTCQQMSEIAKKKGASGERTLEWARETLEVTDPYLIFYLRWSKWRAEQS